MKKLLLLAMFLGVSGAARAQAIRPEILVLGTFHMANPGHDLANMQADDVLSPNRQREIAQVIQVLKRFRPTKIAIEANLGSKRVEKEYSDYLAGNYVLTRNEIDQIGYRLAKELGHRTVYAVDVDGDYPYYRVLNYAKANNRAQEFDTVMAHLNAIVKQEGEFLKTHSILETLLLMNSDSSTAKHVGFEFAYLRFGDQYDYAGADLIAQWYQRNIRIYRNIVALADSPSDRILVVYGNGHLGWLRQNIANDPAVTLRKISEFTGH